MKNNLEKKSRLFFKILAKGTLAQAKNVCASTESECCAPARGFLRETTPSRGHHALFAVWLLRSLQLEVSKDEKITMLKNKVAEYVAAIKSLFKAITEYIDKAADVIKHLEEETELRKVNEGQGKEDQDVHEEGCRV